MEILHVFYICSLKTTHDKRAQFSLIEITSLITKGLEQQVYDDPKTTLGHYGLVPDISSLKTYLTRQDFY